MKLIHAAPVIIAGALWAGVAQAQKPEELVERAAATYNAARTVSVQFDQTVTNSLTNTSATSSGELLRQQPNLLSISFSSPASDRIVADGRALWVYLPSSAPGQVIKMPATQQDGLSVDPLGQILSRPLDRYSVVSAGTATVSGHATHAVTLSPRSSRAMFTTATLWIDDSDGTVRRIDVTEPSGIRRRVTIKRFRTNVSVPRSSFRFTPPAGVRVVDQTGIAGG